MSSYANDLCAILVLGSSPNVAPDVTPACYSSDDRKVLLANLAAVAFYQDIANQLQALATTNAKRLLSVQA